MDEETRKLLNELADALEAAGKTARRIAAQAPVRLDFTIDAETCRQVYESANRDKRLAEEIAKNFLEDDAVFTVSYAMPRGAREGDMNMGFFWKMDAETFKWRMSHDIDHPRKLSVAELEEALEHIESHAMLSPYAEELCRRAGLGFRGEFIVAQDEKGKRRALDRALRELSIMGER